MEQGTKNVLTMIVFVLSNSERKCENTYSSALPRICGCYKYVLAAFCKTFQNIKGRIGLVASTLKCGVQIRTGFQTQ